MRHVVSAGLMLLVIVAGVLAVTAPALAQVSKYVDEQGVTNYTGSADQIPEFQRANATPVVLPAVVMQPDHTGSLKALADATIRLHSVRVPDLGDGGRPTEGDENARLRQAYAAREVARAQYVGERIREASQRGCRFNPNTMHEDCSGGWFPPLSSSIRPAINERSGRIP
jgi:hypothetical protein